MTTTAQLTTTNNPADIICGLKAAITALECYHHMDLLKQREKPKPKPTPPPMYMMIPIEEDTIISRKNQYRPCSSNVPNKEKARRKEHPSKRRITEDDCRVPGLKYPEMRGGVLYTRCNCVHRDGLQDACPLTQCQGQPECLVKPWAVCPPGKYMRCRYPEQYGGESDSNNRYDSSSVALAG